MLVVILWKALTGGLHLDGLADCLDGLAGRDPAHRVAIMRDSRIGVFGAVGLVFAIALSLAAMAALPGAARASTLLLAPVVGRLAPLVTGAVFSAATPSAGSGDAFISALPRAAGFVHAALVLLLGFLLAGPRGIAMVVGRSPDGADLVGLPRPSSGRTYRRWAGRRRGAGRARGAARGLGGRSRSPGAECARPSIWCGMARWWAPRPGASSDISTCRSRRRAKRRSRPWAVAWRPCAWPPCTRATSSARAGAPRSSPRLTGSPPCLAGLREFAMGRWEGAHRGGDPRPGAGRLRGVAGGCRSLPVPRGNASIRWRRGPGRPSRTS